MVEKVKEYLEKAKKEELIRRGLYEKKYYDSQDVTIEMRQKLKYDNENDKFYEPIPYDITDEEFQLLLRIPALNENQEKESETISTIFYTVGTFIFIIGFIAGIILGAYGSYNEEFSWGVAFGIWVASFIYGIIFIGFGKIIALLNEIKNAIKNR